ncbi:tetratricopeptide repeat protein [Treponema sp.]|uniref:tetratricopeptide repeat protein n=1 Tax=Treponema sp. TaxID=166 RepID=UPI00298D8FE1|nr:tetratricopeptide repeat protein [Treponema sp.]MCQ2241437.1 tetratricopeptide repeat protein [Treponema sp.]
MKGRYGLELYYHRKRLVVFGIIASISGLIVISILSYFLVKVFRDKVLNSGSVSSLYSNWDLHTQEGYKNVYDISSGILENKPYHNNALAFHGYSAFMLAEYETDNQKAQSLLDEAIFSLRTALRNCKENTVAQLEYMLGRSYFYKDKLSNYHYYSDLVVKYLSDAQDRGYSSDDIPLLLGLSYASLGETDNSIAAFTEALLVRESDTLLFDIAKQYCKNEQNSVAKQYLVRVLETSSNEELLNSSHILLGQIYISEENYDEAEAEYNMVLQKDDNFADAHYGLGLIYEFRGDTVKARAEWRRCLKIQFNHPGALSKMS